MIINNNHAWTKSLAALDFAGKRITGLRSIDTETGFTTTVIYDPQRRGSVVTVASLDLCLYLMVPGREARLLLETEAGTGLVYRDAQLPPGTYLKPGRLLQSLHLKFSVPQTGIAVAAAPPSRCECGAYAGEGIGRGQVGHSSWCPWTH